MRVARQIRRGPTRVVRDIPQKTSATRRARVIFFGAAVGYPSTGLSPGCLRAARRDARQPPPRDATQHATGNTWFSTDGGRHTDGKDEQTAPRRTRSLQSLPRRWWWRWRWRRKSGGRGERGARTRVPPPPPPGRILGQKGMSVSISTKGARTRIMHVAGVDRGRKG